MQYSLETIIYFEKSCSVALLFFQCYIDKSDTFLKGTGVAFAPEPCWVAFAPEWSAMKWVQGRMWPLLLRGRRNSFRASKGFFPP